ncbi:hypothetical protein D3C85_1501500 [compost metagenome]
MINNNHPARFLHKSGLHSHRSLMGVYNNKQRILCHQRHRLIRADEPLFQGIILLNPLHNTFNRRINPVQHNMCLNIVHIRRLEDPDRSSNHVQIRHSMAHDDNAVALLH